jgi:DNA-binding Lrp family transcriptional regulator
MFHGRSANELGLASAAVVLSLIQRLEKKGTIKREDALALLGGAADRLVATPRDTTVSTQGAADLIRKEFLTKV